MNGGKKTVFSTYNAATNAINHLHIKKKKGKKKIFVFRKEILSTIFEEYTIMYYIYMVRKMFQYFICIGLGLCIKRFLKQAKM